MAVPKKRPSIHKRRIRKANWAKVLPSLVKCSCGAYRIPHCACGVCGKYKDRQVLNIN